MKLFSPGPVPSNTITFSHRSSEFCAVYTDTAEPLLALSGYNNVLFAQGSAFCAIETVLSSVLKRDHDAYVVVNGEFGRRAAVTAAYYCDNVTVVDSLDKVGNGNVCFVVQFETSTSHYNDLSRFSFDGTLIVDAVSSFPYYPVPNADFVITSSSKQLRGLPVMGIIFYNFLPELMHRSDYLNLAKYIEYAERQETPHTSLMPQFFTLNESLKDFDLTKHRAAVSNNAMTLTAGLEKFVVNEQKCPVVTLSLDVKAELEKAGFGVYKNEKYTNKGCQISCFNYYETEVYAELNAAIRKLCP